MQFRRANDMRYVDCLAILHESRVVQLRNGFSSAFLGRSSNGCPPNGVTPPDVLFPISLLPAQLA